MIYEDYLNDFDKAVAAATFLVELNKYLSQYGETNQNYGPPAPQYLAATDKIDEMII